MSEGKPEQSLRKESETPQKCVICGRETRHLVNAAWYETEPEWTPLCSTECEMKFEERFSGEPTGSEG
jgi:hypothetical protein